MRTCALHMYMALSFVLMSVALAFSSAGLLTKLLLQGASPGDNVHLFPAHPGGPAVFWCVISQQLSYHHLCFCAFTATSFQRFQIFNADATCSRDHAAILLQASALAADAHANQAAERVKLVFMS